MIKIKKNMGLTFSVSFVILLIVMTVGCGTEENSLEAIKERGKLIVGTSADFPPFEFYEDGEYKGFDIELINEIGNRMNVDVEIQDMGFDTLIAALKQGKIDAVIAKMSAEPERREQVDFSEIYLKTPHGFLTKVGSGVTFGGPKDLQKYKVGIQTGTAHEKWIVENLVNEGLMPEENLFRYEKADVGILDVVNGGVDVYIVDLPIAKANADKYEELEVSFEYDLNPEHGGARIAVQKNQSELLNAINEVIFELKDEGFIKELEEKWVYGDIQ